LDQIRRAVEHNADRFYLRNSLRSGDLYGAAAELTKMMKGGELDILTLTDTDGRVLLRAGHPERSGDSQRQDELVRVVLETKQTAAATTIVAGEELERESPELSERAFFQFVETPKARVREETEEKAGMMLKAAAPVFGDDDRLIGILYGGVLLNRRYDIVDKIKHTVFLGLQYKGKDIGAATIFQDDVRMSTNVKYEDGTRAIGTRVTEEVYDRVVRHGKTWIGAAQVMDSHYLTAYEPVRNLRGEVVGILGVGILEDKYSDLKERTVLLYLALTMTGALMATGLSFFISRRLSIPVKQLVAASRELARGNLDTKVAIRSDGEMAQLAEAFNFMAYTLKRRDKKLREFAKKKIMESEKLAVVGQLAADVAHELNNPLQGIVTYSHLLLEQANFNPEQRESIEKIGNQADRCTRIIRSLLDFSRQRKPVKKLTDVNAVLGECLSLVENQAQFHNIEVIKEWSGGLPHVVVDPSQIQQVFINMVINAAESMEDGGCLTIATCFENRDQVIEVEFRDTGHGIREENIERIFDPFFTTKEVGHGTGLGLAISYGIIKEHRGTISVESQVGQGTTFNVRLPVTTEEAESGP
jgi:two-component system NtrC family sensor kinase